jgi:uncharacterized protein
MSVTTTFSGLTAGEWDRLAGRHFYSTSRWLSYCSNDIGVPGSAVVSYAGDDPAWAVPVRELAKVPFWSRYRWNDHLTEHGLPLLAPEGVLIGPSEGFQTHFLCAAPDRPVDSLARLIAEVRDRCGRGQSCVAMYLTTEDVMAARAAGVLAEPVLLDVDAWIPVPDGGWPAWLDSLPSKRRRRIRHEDRAFAAAGYHVDHLPLAQVCDRIGAASAATLGKHGYETTPESEAAALRRVAENMGDAARVAVCHFGDGDPVGFCVYYLWADVCFGRWAGFDYTRLAGAEEYFNLCYYTQVKRAPETGIRWIHAGATAQAAKALRGAELRPLWMLDLTEGSPLERSAGEVRRHNLRMHAQFAQDPRIAPRLRQFDWLTVTG